jgi:two-component system, cell cycle response regulator
MPDPSAEQYTVAVQGFRPMERVAVSRFFRLATNRPLSYVKADRLDQCDFIVANTDHERSLHAVLEASRAGDTVFVGSRAPQGAIACLTRPVEPAQILLELDGAVERRRSRARQATHELQAPEEVSPPGSVSSGPSRGDVLVVEDSPIARRFMQMRLQRLGYRVQLACNAEQALPLLAREHFGLVFIDVVLGPPGSMDGLAMCQQLKQDPALTAAGCPKVVIVTGMNSESDRVRALLAGCDAYLTKPVSEAAFLQALRTVDPGFGAPQRKRR